MNVGNSSSRSTIRRSSRPRTRPGNQQGNEGDGDVHRRRQRFAKQQALETDRAHPEESGGEREGASHDEAREDPPIGVRGDLRRVIPHRVVALDGPIATCYRRVESLTDAGPLENGGQVFSEGQRASAYRRAVDRIVVEFEDDRYTIELEDRSDADRG
jgi:hypothetical protein